MVEKTVPWWRRALQFALGGIRSGFGLFQRGAKPGEMKDSEPEGRAEAEIADAYKGVGTAAAAQEKETGSGPEIAGKNEAEELAKEIPRPVVAVSKASGAISDLPKSGPADEEVAPVGEKVEAAQTETVEIEHAGTEKDEAEGPEVEEPAPGQEAVEAEVEPAIEEEAKGEPIPAEATKEEQTEPKAAMEEGLTEEAVDEATKTEEHPVAVAGTEETAAQEPMEQELPAEDTAPEVKLEDQILEEPDAGGAGPEDEGSVEVGNEAATEVHSRGSAEAAGELEALVPQEPAAEEDIDERVPIDAVEEPKEAEAEELEAPAGASEVEADEMDSNTELEPEADRAEADPPEEPMAAHIAAIEEPIDEKQAEELETVEAKATVVATGANEQAEMHAEEVKAVAAAAEEPVAPASSAEPEAVHIEEPSKEEEIQVRAAVVEVHVTEEPVHGAAEVVREAAKEETADAHTEQGVEAPVVESEALDAIAGGADEELKEEPVATAAEVVNLYASGEMVEAHVAEHAGDLLAAEAAIATHNEGDEAEQPARLEEPVSLAVAEAEPQAEPEVESQAAETEAKALPAAEAKAETVTEAVAEAAAAPAQLELIPKPPVDEKAAAKKAEQEKRRKEAEEESPFSVMVDHVYDGPLDLLLDLIRKQDIDIYDIPIAKITAQFLAYVNQLKASDVDVAGEFIYTASLLIHIKSKMLLPRTAEAPGEAAEDPRRELVERLLEHERFKNAAQMLQQKQMMEAASWSNPGFKEFVNDEGAEPEIAADTVDLVRVFREILERARTRPVLDVSEDTVTVGQMIRFLGRRLTMEDKPIALRKLLSHTRSERALIAMFLALLELVRLQAILLRQDKAFSEIFVKKHGAFDAVMNDGLANARDDWR